MERRKIRIAAALAVLVVGAACVLAAGQQPFRDLEASEILWAKVRLTPPDITVQIPDTEELAGYLRRTVIYRRDDSYTEYCGQGVTFTLEMADGTERTVMAYAPFLAIDGVGYRTKYQPCEALNSYANRLLDTEDALLEEIPALTVVSAENCALGAVPGPSSWQRRGPGGTIDRREDGGSPLETPETLETSAPFVTLRFTCPPDRIVSARRWRDGAELAGESEDVAVDGDTLMVAAGRYLYEVRAQWDVSNGCGGTASYRICVEGTGE